MPGIADLLYLGQPNPEQQIAQMLSGQGNPAQGPGPNGAPLPNGPGSNNAQDPSNPVAPGSTVPNSPPQPQALQSSPDMAQSFAQLASPQGNNLMSLYLKMDQRDRAENQINHGLALIAANYAGNPASARAIMDSVNSGQGDAGGTVNNLMSIYGFQQKQASMQAMLGQVDTIAQKLNLDPAVVRAKIMAGGGDELIKAMEPTEETRNINAEHDMFIKNAVAQGTDPKAAEADWQKNIFPYKILAGRGGGDATQQSWQTERIRWNQEHPGEPVPWGDDTPTSYGLWKTKQDELAKDQGEALDRRTTYVQNLTDLRNGLGGLVGLKGGDSFNFKDDGTLDTSNLDPDKLKLIQSALSANLAQTYLSGDPKDLAMQKLTDPFITQDQKKVLDQLREITDPKKIYGSISQHPTRRAQSDVTEIGSGLGGLTNIRSKSPDDWLNGVVGTVKTLDTATGNAFGASGEAENAPDYAKPYINPSYLKGGSMYPYNKKAATMSQDQINFATDQIKNATDKEAMRQKLIHAYLADNVDPAPLRNLR